MDDQSDVCTSGHASEALSPMGESAPSNPPATSSADMRTEALLPVKLTPITGHVSKAKKGAPVHTCDACQPPKVSFYTAI